MLTHFVVGNGLAKKKSRKKFVEELKIFVLKQFSRDYYLSRLLSNMPFNNANTAHNSGHLLATNS